MRQVGGWILGELPVEQGGTRAIIAECPDINVKRKNWKLKLERALGTVENAFASTDGNHGCRQIQLRVG
ncbi:hypothetical protein EMIT0P4_60113 [Pseudomonas sp. IT-P4]